MTASLSSGGRRNASCSWLTGFVMVLGTEEFDGKFYVSIFAQPVGVSGVSRRGVHCFFVPGRSYVKDQDGEQKDGRVCRCICG